MALLAIILYTVALSLAALKVGAHLALALDRFTPTLPFRLTRRFFDPLVVVLAWGCWLGAIFLSIWPPDRPSGSSSRGSWANEVWRGEVLFALVFAPIGCLLRYYASLKLNPIAGSFPLGTFAVNVFGCAVEAMCYSIQHVPITSTAGALVGGGRVSCQVLQGVMDGFCGTTTTISTWVSELQSLRRRHAYVYGMVSVVAGLCFMIIIMGSVRWTVGFSTPACVTMRTSL
jgi:CrcB protein